MAASTALESVLDIESFIGFPGNRHVVKNMVFGPGAWWCGRP